MSVTTSLQAIIKQNLCIISDSTERICIAHVKCEYKTKRTLIDLGQLEITVRRKIFMLGLSDEKYLLLLTEILYQF